MASLSSAFVPQIGSSAAFHKRTNGFSVKSTTEDVTENKDFNVVFRPSEVDDKFDSFKIGGARVHRYPGGVDGGESEYTMWYHGRSKAAPMTGEESNENLAPLSTGRIGMAYSRNGLAWERQKEGSKSEDMKGVALGLNRESWWAFDTAHCGLGQVLLPMSTPAIMSDSGVYLMYYMGGNYEEEPLSQYLVSGDEDAKIKGMRMKIGVALSQDGKTWGRIEGDDHTGAVMVPYDKEAENNENIIRDDDSSVLNIDEELYCGWPEVVVANTDANEDKNRSKKKNKAWGFFMFYSTMLKHTKEKAIACAVSMDGFRWEKRGVCLLPDTNDISAMDCRGVARCNVNKRAFFDEDAEEWTFTDGWTMLYEGVAEDGKHRIMEAESEDGRTWTKTGLVLDIGDDDAWDCNGVGSPHILRMDDGDTRMYYTGVGSDGSTAIGVAKKGADGGIWTREKAQFTFSEV